MVQEFHSKQEFLVKNSQLINENFYVFYAALTSLLDDDIKTHRLCNVVSNNSNSLVIIIFLDGLFLIHSFKWEDEIIEELSKVINFSRFKNYSFVGRKDLLLRLLEENKVNYDISKERKVYKCSQISRDVSTKGVVKIAKIADLEELSIMGHNYHKDEYGKNAFRDLNHFRELIENGIRDESIYNLVKDNDIVSIAQLMETNGIRPVIGLLYTKDEFRNKGFATSMVRSLTQIALNKGYPDCGLLADSRNESSLRVFEKVGYESIYEQVAIWKGE